jgi:hypothetical protein
MSKALISRNLSWFAFLGAGDTASSRAFNCPPTKAKQTLNLGTVLCSCTVRRFW